MAITILHQQLDVSPLPRYPHEFSIPVLKGSLEEITKWNIFTVTHRQGLWEPIISQPSQLVKKVVGRRLALQRIDLEIFQ
jgi:hypothetical protein